MREKDTEPDREQVARWTGQIIAAVETVILGKPETVRLAAACLLCNGHLLIEDIPGVGKTMLARSLARAIGGTFHRVQFTPDLLPADITGTTIYNQKTAEFTFHQGPVFTNVLLADEINRAAPKTQSALLECMEEGQVTRDGHTYTLPRPFLVIATENVIESQGTFPLPEAQLDRFLMRLSLGYPRSDDEVAILGSQIKRHPILNVQPVLEPAQIIAAQDAVSDVFVHDSLKEYIVQIVAATRRHPALLLGASPRGSLALMRAAQALAAIEGRSFITPEDVKYLAAPVLEHRLVLRDGVRAQGTTTAKVIEAVLAAVPAPLADAR